MPKDESLKIVENTELAKDIRRLVFERGLESPFSADPGQFAMVQVCEGANPLLRRPLSFLYADNIRIEFLYRVVGIGTRILARAKPGDSLNILGPLGKGFDTSLVKNKVLLIAGGMGLPPVHFLARLLKKSGLPEVELIFGAKSAGEIVLTESLKKEGITVHIATEDGSAGFAGLATELMKERLKSGTKPEAVYACGPHAMLAAVAAVARDANIPCQVSVEANMACGLGACLGCAMPTASGDYVQVCEQGPVFDAKVLFRGS